MATVNRLQRAALGVAFLVLFGFGTATASQPNVAIGAVGLDAGTLTHYFVTRSIGDAPATCFQNIAPKPSYGCFYSAVRASGLGGLLDGAHPVTVLAPTDAAFRHLADTVGEPAVRAFLRNPATASELVRGSVVNGALSVEDLATLASQVTSSTQLATVGGATLAVTFDAVGYDTARTSVDVGAAGAVDGQSFVAGTPVRFDDGDVLIPLGRVTLASLGR